MDKPKVAVLMSTYNGQDYIREQIDSILAQNDVDVTIFVRDDGSTDNTVAILKEYAENGYLKFFIGQKNLGSGISFLKLLRNVVGKYDFEYYSYADQDDIWLERKLISAVNMLKKRDVPALYASNQYVYQNGENQGLRFTDVLEDNSMAVRISHNIFYGCTMVFNKLLADKLAYAKMPPKDIIYYRYHDTWTMLAAVALGDFIYDPNAYILYRIHDKNEVGLKKVGIKGRINNLLKKGKGSTERSNLRSKSAKALINRYSDIKEENFRILKLYAEYQQSFKNKIKLLTCNELVKGAAENKAIFALKILLNFV